MITNLGKEMTGKLMTAVSLYTTAIQSDDCGNQLNDEF